MKKIEPYKIQELNFCKNNWLANKNLEMLVSENTIACEEDLALVYKGQGGSVKVLEDDCDLQLWFVGEITAEVSGVLSPQLQACVRLILYDENDVPTIKVYPINQPISSTSERCKNLSLVLDFKGSGTFEFGRLSLDLVKCATELERKREYLESAVIHIENELCAWSNAQTNHHETQKIAVIMDCFSEQCFQYEAQLLNLSRDNWRMEMDQFRPDLLLVESAWMGRDGSWSQILPRYQQDCHPEILELLAYCRRESIPTAFWHKEGLINFYYFSGMSRYFEWLFVTDERLIPYYEQLCGHQRIYPLPFAAQPRIHHSINKNRWQLGDVAFAGAWYGQKHPDRLIDIKNILDPARAFDLTIFDRNWKDRVLITQQGNYWPIEYRKHIIGEVDYRVLSQLYKYYNVFLNVNSIQESEVMVARRVYEILMAKTAVVSGKSKGITAQFQTYVQTVESQQETTWWLKKLTTDWLYRERYAKEGQRYVLANHTYRHRMTTILDKMGLGSVEHSNEKVYVWIWKGNHTERLIQQMEKQTYPNVEIGVHETNECLEVEASYIAFVQDHYCYSKHYLQDAINSMRLSHADLVGRASVFEYNHQQLYLLEPHKGDCYANRLLPGTLVVKREKCSAIFALERTLKDKPKSYCKALESLGLCGYSDDAFGLYYEGTLEVGGERQLCIERVQQEDLVENYTY